MENNESSEIKFNCNPVTWVMALKENRIIFNREEFPNSTPDDFAKAVIEILENCYTVKFERKQHPYDRNENKGI